MRTMRILTRALIAVLPLAGLFTLSMSRASTESAMLQQTASANGTVCLHCSDASRGLFGNQPGDPIAALGLNWEAGPTGPHIASSTAASATGTTVNTPNTQHVFALVNHQVCLTGANDISCSGAAGES